MQLLQDSLNQFKTNNQQSGSPISGVAIWLFIPQTSINWDGVAGQDWGSNWVTVNAAEGTSMYVTITKVIYFLHWQIKAGYFIGLLQEHLLSILQMWQMMSVICCLEWFYNIDYLIPDRLWLAEHTFRAKIQEIQTSGPLLSLEPINLSWWSIAINS